MILFLIVFGIFKTCFLHLGRPILSGNTIAHYIEQSCGAIYRYHKIFDTQVFNGERFVGTGYGAFLCLRRCIGVDYGVDFFKSL